MKLRTALCAAAMTATIACSTPSSAPDDSASDALARDGSNGMNDAAQDLDVLDASITDSASADSATSGDGGGGCATPGRFAAPMETFTLPAPNAQGELYVPDVRARFPMVPWDTLDRLYIPAGRYTLINLGNLPTRAAARPLVITNAGGQVLIRPNAGSRQGYLWSVSGGANWVITGRYDPIARTGDSAFRGHDCGAYANSRERYGIVSDGIFLNEGHMGIGVSNATDFELDFIEVTRSGFAGVRINNSAMGGATPAPLTNIRLHDLYVHDIQSEAIYFGWTGAPPSPLAARTQIYNNRLLRTGTEALQVQNLGDGSEIHHNVVAWGALDWRAAFGNYQDNASQLQLRRGAIRVHHNVIMGGASTLGNYFFGNEPGDGARQVSFEDNYFADTLSLGLYFGGTSGADSTLALRRNYFRGLDFGYASVYPMATDPGVVLRHAGTITGPIVLDSNVWEGSRALTDGITNGNGTRGMLTATGNANRAVEPIAFVESGYPAVPTRRLELWTDRATLAPGMPAVTYMPGALVMYDARLYECIAMNSGARPDTSPASWRPLPLPADDVRVAPSSVYSRLGVGLSAP